MTDEKDDAKNDATVRKFVVTGPGAKLTKLKRARLVAPLVLRLQQEQQAEELARLAREN